MHEMSIAQSIVDIVREEMARYNVEKLEAINLAVGKMSAVVPQHLSFCFGVLVDKTDLEGTRLNIREVPLTYRCQACGHGFETDQVALACPACGEEAPRLEHGRELAVESIEVADLEAEPPPDQLAGDLGS
jgi:hydrogenase nickel incorporation protein HypA/HybF